METGEELDGHKRQYSERRPYSLRELKTREDWNEWQANVLGAALLMPGNAVERLMRDRYCQDYKIVSHGGFFSRYDRWTITDMCEMLEVSRSAAITRLRELGRMEEYRPETEAVIWE